MKKLMVMICMLALPALVSAKTQGPIKLDCKDITTVSATGNGSNAAFQVMFRTNKDGLTFHKNFLPPQGYLQASRFQQDILSPLCDTVELFYQRKSGSNMLNVTTFSISKTYLRRGE